MDSNPQSFRQFSDQLRLQTGNLANLSLNDSIWSNSFVSKRHEERRNFDVRSGGEVNSLTNFKPEVSDSDVNRLKDGWNSFKPSVASDLMNWSNSSGSSNLSSSGFEKNALNMFDNGWNSFKPKGSDFNSFNDGWKLNSANMGVDPLIGGAQKGINGGFNKGVYAKIGNYNTNSFVNLKNYKNSGKIEEENGGRTGKKNSNKKNSGENTNDNNKDSNKNALDKRFKTLPPSESLPRNETVGGYIFVCNNDTMQENLKRQLFGLPPRYRDSVRAITPGLPIFLYNYSTHQLHGIFEAASFGGTNIDPTAWEDKKTPADSSFSRSLANVSSSSYLSIPIMSSAADPVASSDAPATVAAVAQPVENDSKSKKAAASKASKAKKPSGAKRTRSSPTHPPFFEMISEAIVSLKERTGSSQYAITKFSEEKHKQLPSNFRKLLLVHLKKLVAADKLVKVKNSYKLPSARSKAAAAPVVAKKPASSKLKAAVSVKKAAVAKPKAKTAVKPKPKVVAKPKAAAKSKVVAKPKAVAPAKRKAAEKVKKVAPKPKPAAKPAKVAKTLSRTSPGKKAAPAAKAKKVAAKKPKTVKSPARKVQARKVKK